MARFSVVCLSLIFLGGCGTTPYQVKSYNYDGPQQEATITISDPQIYSREALINDRHDESRLYGDLLKESAKIEGEEDFRKRFVPELARDIEIIEALTTSLDATFDPTSNVSGQLQRVNEDTEIYEARVERLKAQAAYGRALQGDFSDPAATPATRKIAATSDDAGGSTDENGSDETGGDETESGTDGEDQESSESDAGSDAAVTDGFARIDKRLDALANAVGDLATRTEDTSVRSPTITTASPYDQLRDLRSYRTELRQLHAQEKLDDLHDFEGNALYRMQFDLTVAPGPRKTLDSFGVARLTIKPPTMSDDQIKELYLAWLAHVNQRLNYGLKKNRGLSTDPAYWRLANSGMFDIISMPYQMRPKNSTSAAGHGWDSCMIGEELTDCGQIRIAVPAGTITSKAPRALKTNTRSLLQVIGETHSDVDLNATDTKRDKLTRNIYDSMKKRVGSWARKGVAEQAIEFRKSRISSELQAVINKLEVEKAGKQKEREPVAAQLISEKDALEKQRLEQELADIDRQIGTLDREIDRFVHVRTAYEAELDGLSDLVTKEVGEDSADLKARHNGYPRELDWNGTLQSYVAERLAAAEDEFARLAEPTGCAASPDLLHFSSQLWLVDNDSFTRQTRSSLNWLSRIIRDEGLMDGCKIEVTVPPEFRKLVAPDTDDKDTAQNTFAYAVEPAQRNQRMSTVARAATSMEMALDVSARLMGDLTNAGLGVGYMKAAAGNAEALENLPQVVSFADRYPVNKPGKMYPHEESEVSPYPRVGWILGPRAVIRKDEIVFQHSPKHHRVYADISVPAWWPYVNLQKETAWAGKWETDDLLPTQERYDLSVIGDGGDYKVKLPLNRADLDGLTAYLSRKTVGTSLKTMRIQHVDPFYISACSDQVTLLVEGSNLWRGSEVYLGGVPADSVRVLPNMEGIAATFDIAKMLETKNVDKNSIAGEQWVNLNVWSRNGSDEKALKLIGDRHEKGQCNAPTSVAPTSSEARPTIAQVSPESLLSCESEHSVAINMNQMQSVDEDSTSIGFLLSGVRGEVEQLDEGGKRRTYLVKFDKQFPADASPLELTAVTSRGISQLQMDVKKCTAKKKEAKATFELVDKYVINKGKNGALDFKIAFKASKLPETELRLAYREKVEGQDFKWIDSTARPDQEGESYVAYFNKHPENANLQNGQILEFALINRPEGKNEVREISKSPVYYFADADKAKVSTSKKADGNDLEVSLVFPKNWDKAYPDAVGAKLSVDISAVKDGAKALEEDLKVGKDGKAKIKIEGLQAIIAQIKPGEEAKKLTFKLKTEKDAPVIKDLEVVAAKPKDDDK